MGPNSYAYDYRKPIDMAMEKCKVCSSAQYPLEFLWDIYFECRIYESINYVYMIRI